MSQIFERDGLKFYRFKIGSQYVETTSSLEDLRKRWKEYAFHRKIALAGYQELLNWFVEAIVDNETTFLWEPPITQDISYLVNW